MTPDDMARELRAAGWYQLEGRDGWRSTSPFCPTLPLVSAHGLMKELAQQRERGTVTTPVVGEEAE